MLSSLNKELKCALLAGCVFAFFFASSMTTVARAATFQWDDGSGGHYSMAPEDSAVALYTNDNIKGVPNGGDRPMASGPNNGPGVPVCDSPYTEAPGDLAGWWAWISSFFTMLLSSFAK